MAANVEKLALKSNNMDTGHSLNEKKSSENSSTIILMNEKVYCSRKRRKQRIPVQVKQNCNLVTEQSSPNTFIEKNRQENGDVMMSVQHPSSDDDNCLLMNDLENGRSENDVIEDIDTNEDRNLSDYLKSNYYFDKNNCIDKKKCVSPSLYESKHWLNGDKKKRVPHGARKVTHSLSISANHQSYGALVGKTTIPKKSITSLRCRICGAVLKRTNWQRLRNFYTAKSREVLHCLEQAIGGKVEKKDGAMHGCKNCYDRMLRLMAVDMHLAKLYHERQGLIMSIKKSYKAGQDLLCNNQCNRNTGGDGCSAGNSNVKESLCNNANILPVKESESKLSVENESESELSKKDKNVTISTLKMEPKNTNSMCITNLLQSDSFNDLNVIYSPATNLLKSIIAKHVDSENNAANKKETSQENQSHKGVCKISSLTSTSMATSSISHSDYLGNSLGDNRFSALRTLLVQVSPKSKYRSPWIPNKQQKSQFKQINNKLTYKSKPWKRSVGLTDSFMDLNGNDEKDKSKTVVNPDKSPGINDDFTEEEEMDEFSPAIPESSANYHISVEHGTMETITDSIGISSAGESSAPFVCEICGKSYPSKSGYRYHLKIHSGHRPFECSYCKKTFVEAHILKQHERIHTGDKPYKCQWCGACFAQHSQIRVHERKHTKERPYKCDECDKCFACNASLKAHKNSHLNNRPYVCEVCGKSYLWPNHLRSHMKYHKDPAYNCIYCEKKFISPSELNSHQRSHTGERPFVCNLCGKGFTQSCHLNTHKKNTHKNEKQKKTLECMYCGRKCANYQGTKNHERMCRQKLTQAS